MLFANDIVLIDEVADGLDSKLGQWRHTIGNVAIPRPKEFKYLGSIIEEKGDIDKDINQCIRVG